MSKEQLVAAVKKAGVSDDSVARELGKGLESGIMTILTADFYHSSNGDRWQLVRDTDTDRRIVRHEPNISSGGRVTDTLGRGMAGPNRHQPGAAGVAGEVVQHAITSRRERSYSF